MSDQKKLTPLLLTELMMRGERGTVAEDLMPLLGVSHPKGMGSRLGRINEALREAKFSPEDVYESRKTANGRIWVPGERLEEALDTLTKR